MNQKTYVRLETTPDRHRAFKATCVSKGKTMTEVLDELMQQYIASNGQTELPVCREKRK